MRVGEAPAAKIRHRIGLAPDDVVQDPKAQILKNPADAENVVIGADHENRRVLLHHPAHGRKPGAGEGVIIREARELVPIVVDRVDQALVRPRQGLLELQIIGRIGEDEIDALGRQPRQPLDAIADQDLIEGQRADCRRHGREPRPRRLITRDLGLRLREGSPGTCDTHKHHRIRDEPRQFALLR